MHPLLTCNLFRPVCIEGPSETFISRGCVFCPVSGQIQHVRLCACYTLLCHSFCSMRNPPVTWYVLGSPNMSSLLDNKVMNMRAACRHVANWCMQTYCRVALCVHAEACRHSVYACYVMVRWSYEIAASMPKERMLATMPWDSLHCVLVAWWMRVGFHVKSAAMAYRAVWA